MTMKIKPVGNFVMVKPLEVKNTTEAGIVLVQDERRELVSQEYGTIVAVGPLAWQDYSEEPWAVVGDNVIYSKYGGKLVRYPGETDVNKFFVILNDTDILAKYEE